MLNFPVLIIPNDPVEAWRADGAARNYLMLGAGYLYPPGRGLQLLGFQGSGVLGERYVRDAISARIALAGYETVDSVVRLVKNARGSISLQLFSPEDQAVYFLNDPLGGAPIYHYRSECCQAFSSDLGSLVSSLRTRGAPLHGAPKYFAAGQITGTQSYGAPSPYKQISVFRRGVGAKVDAMGLVSTIDICSRESLYRPTFTYDQGLHQLRHEVLCNVKTAVDGNFEGRYSHLTGGFDSRLVLAAIRCLGLESHFIFSCIENSKDWTVAKQLAGELGLSFSAFDGNPRGAGYALNYFESLTRTARRSFGSIVSGIEPTFLSANSLVFQGGYGEVGRTFNTFRWDEGQSSPTELAYLLWRYAGYPRDEERNQTVWADSFLDELAELVRTYVEEAAELELEDDFFTNYLYVEGRNRHWIGLQSYYASSVRSQFDPLYSKVMVAAPRLLDWEMRRSNFLGFDLMRSLSPELLEFPFDRPRIGYLYEKERGNILRREFTGKLPKLIQPSNSHQIKAWPGRVDQPDQRDSEIAKTLGLSSLVVHGVRTYGARALELISALDELQSIYRIERLVEKWNGGELASKSDFLLMNSVISTLFLSSLLQE